MTPLADEYTFHTLKVFLPLAAISPKFISFPAITPDNLDTSSNRTLTIGKAVYRRFTQITDKANRNSDSGTGVVEAALALQ
jgi:hypothetical protein